MKRRDNVVFVRDMLDAIGQVEVYLHAVSYDAFCQDRMRQDAVVRQLEIIGEAGRNLALAFQNQHPQIPWQDIIGMRHKIAHDYFDVDIRVVWDTAKHDLPMLKQQLEQMLQHLSA